MEQFERQTWQNDSKRIGTEYISVSKGLTTTGRNIPLYTKKKNISWIVMNLSSISEFGTASSQWCRMLDLHRTLAFSRLVACKLKYLNHFRKGGCSIVVSSKKRESVFAGILPFDKMNRGSPVQVVRAVELEELARFVHLWWKHPKRPGSCRRISDDIFRNVFGRECC